jgi:anaerobic magnesium-protoporphyrin IX monomethyl ester cyclase
MKILCLNPPFKTEYGRFSRTSRSPAVTKSGTIYYPIWLCYAAGVLEDAGFDVKVIDSCAEGYDLPATIARVTELKPDLAVLDTSTPSIYSDIETGRAIKSRFPDCVVVLMGTHPSALPEETLAVDGAIDAVTVGEADYTLRELAQRLDGSDRTRLATDAAYRERMLQTIDGLAWRSGERITVNRRRPFVENLDELPFVSGVYRRHLDVRKYFFGASDYPEVQIMTARGCIARCTFCVYPQTIHGWRYRTRSARSVADEFQWIVENLPEVREIGIEDDTFTGSQKRAVEFCRELIRRDIRIKWYCNVRVDLEYETMQWMRKAGCVLVTVGYESANDQILKNIDKRATAAKILEFSRNTRRAGLLVHGCFMAGNRGETRETLLQSLEFSLRLMDDTMQFFPLMVYPGTKDYDWAKGEGLLTVDSWADYVTADGNHNSVLRMPDMNSDEIREWCNHARRRYYLRPRYLLYKLLQQVTRPSEIRRTFKAAKRFIRFLRPSGKTC